MKWKAAIPPGHSSPVFTNSHIFLTAHSADKDNYKLFVLALDRKSGKELWRHEVERRQKGRLELVNGPASPSPVTDGSNVYFFFQEYGLISYTADGKERWRLPLGRSHVYGFAPRCSGIWQAEPRPIRNEVLLRRAKGQALWRVSRPTSFGLFTPRSAAETGPAQILIRNLLAHLDSIAAGRLWWVEALRAR